MSVKNWFLTCMKNSGQKAISARIDDTVISIISVNNGYVSSLKRYAKPISDTVLSVPRDILW